MRDGRGSLIVALDVPDSIRARALVYALGDAVSYYKIGKELFTAEGPAFVRELVASGKRVFLDLKFHDIPNTVAAAVRTAASLGVSLLTVHAGGGSKMLKAATEAASQSDTKPTILAVTVLTSMTQEDLLEVGGQGTVESQVLRLAGLAINAGCGGIVASAREAARLRQELGSGFVLVTPGIRPAGGIAADQARVVTPGDAIRAGANYIVVGRPITASDDPATAARNITEQTERAFQH
ncbi:MAG TPA: orotidine-5'-phosphate decarboxylase [Candidatus Saccharimonadales bacterium]|nr:orotidine-5'-phosphate decarboxylase [Candidatus Saccharimonadales bacterium]